MYALAKFQPVMPLTFGVMALQSGNNKKIDLYSKQTILHDQFSSQILSL